MCGGAGFRTLATIATKLKFERLWQTKTLLRPEGFELWLGRGCPLNPYLRGHLIGVLRKEMKPSELRLIPDELFIT